MNRNTHILNAASNLLGIALLIVTGINITNQAQRSLADEAASVAAVLLALSCFLSYLSIRNERRSDRLEGIADKAFMLGVAGLIISVLVLALSHR